MQNSLDVSSRVPLRHVVPYLAVQYHTAPPFSRNPTITTQGHRRAFCSCYTYCSATWGPALPRGTTSSAHHAMHVKHVIQEHLMLTATVYLLHAANVSMEKKVRGDM